MGKRKLSEHQRKHIRIDYQGGARISMIAKKYGVSWATIQLVIDPVKEEKNKARARERQRQLRKKEQ